METHASTAVARPVISIEAEPEPITIDIATTAALVVDMQNDFCTKGGMFDRAGIDISSTRRAVQPTAHALACMRKAEVPVIYLKMGFRPDLSDFGSSDAPNRIKHLPMGVGTKVTAPDGRQSRILIRNTWNTDIVIYKTRYSGFYGTDLDAVLKTRGIKSLVITGVSTSVCVESTLRDAMFRDYRCLLLADCTGEAIGHDLPRPNHDASLLVIQVVFGWVSESAEIIRALGPAK